MRKTLTPLLKYSVLLLAMLLLGTNWSQNTARATASSLSPNADLAVQQVLQNIATNGWNPQAQTHGQTTGGLYINWEMSNPANTNAGAQPTSHDPQVDLYYLNALAEYHTLHPGDTSHNNEIQHASLQVQSDFSNYNVPKGWLYFTLLRDGQLLQNNMLTWEAYTLANNFYTNWYDPTVGMVYNRIHNPTGPILGDYNVEHTLNCGAALIDAGQRWHVQAWIDAGNSTLSHTLAVAINPQYHLFYNNMQVMNNGTQQVETDQAKPSTQGQGAEALVDAYNLTHNSYYISQAYSILQATFSSALWDQSNGGLFFALDMDTGLLHTDYKETRGQTLMLLSLLRLNQTLNQFGITPQFTDKEQALTNLLTNNFYNSTYHGYFYRVTPTFGIYTSKPGQGIGYEDFFTTEAMGTTMDALQQTELPSITF